MIAATSLLFAAFILNGFAAGVVAFLYHWRGVSALGARAVAASFATGTTLALALVATTLGNLMAGGVEETALLFGTMLAIGTVVSLPGAFLMSRKIGARPRSDASTFD